MTALTFTIGDATVVVDWMGQERSHEEDSPRFGPAHRNRYSYVITTSSWQYVGDDIRSGVAARVDVAEAARTLFSFLSACAESRRYAGPRPDGEYFRHENADLFPEHVGTWAELNDDEISLLSMDDIDD